MRVSTVIKDYVRKQVADIYQVKIDEVDKDYNEKRLALEKKCKKEVAKLDKKLMEVVREEGFVVRYGCENVVQINGIYNKEIEDKNRTLKWNLEREREDKITEILACLELGATKEELDKMISDLKKSIK